MNEIENWKTTKETVRALSMAYDSQDTRGLYKIITYSFQKEKSAIFLGIRVSFYSNPGYKNI